MKYYTYILKQDGFIQNPICQNQLKKYPVNRDEDEDDKRQFKKYSLDTIHVLGNANPNTVAFFQSSEFFNSIMARIIFKVH